MYRLLIVDDEPIIVEGLSELFRQLPRLDLDIYALTDAEEACALIERTRMDIVLSDIEMPGMNGIRLQEAAIRQWPKCKFIFLSGYNDFHYIQSSLRNGALDYVLKAEGDEAIVKAVEKALAQIAAEFTYEQLLHKAQSHMSKALPSLRKDYLTELVHGEFTEAVSRQARFAELDIPLNSERPVLMALGRVDKWRENMSTGDKALLMYAVNNIAEECLAGLFQSVHVIDARDQMIWLMQPLEDTADRPLVSLEKTGRFLLETFESIQTSCKQYMKLICSFVVGEEPCQWERISAKYDQLSLLFIRGIGIGEEMLVSDRRQLETLPRREREMLKKIPLLELYLDRRNPDAFFSLYDELMDAMQDKTTVQTGIALEMFYSLSSLFIAYLNKRDLLQEFILNPIMNKLFSIQEHASWAEARSCFREFASLLFSRTANETESETSEIVQRLHAYVDSHLGDDLSLVKLAEIVYLTPFYLSRLYKQKTGGSISDYVMETRILRAKEMLRSTHLKIHEVGLKVGYDSPSYFTRFFKKMTQLTPQEYRDSDVHS